MDWEAIAFCALGSFAVNFLNLIELSKLPLQDRPNLKDVFYWLYFFGMPVLAAIVGAAYVRGGQQLNTFLALQVGASTPLIIRAFASVIPAVVKTQPPQGPSP